MAREMKDSGVPWLGEIPKEWKLVRVKHCYMNHKDIAGDQADEYDRLALTLKGVIKRPKDDSVGLQPEAFDSYQVLRENELVFKLIDLANISTSRVGYSPYSGIVSPAYIILHPNSEAESKFGEYYFLSMWQREVFNHMGDDGVRSSLNVSDLLNTPYLQVSAEEKKRIVDYLNFACEKIDATIDQTRASIEEYKKLKQAVITQAVTKGIRPDRQMRDSGKEWIGEYPAEWEILRLKWLLNERNERSENGEEEPLSMSQKYGLIPTKDMDIVPNMASSFIGAKKCHINDLVFNKLKAHLGVFAVSQYDGLVSPDYAVYYTNDKVNLKYLEYLFKTPQYIGEFRKKSTGIAAGLTRLYTDGLYSIHCALPSLMEQEEIVQYLNNKIAAMDSLLLSKEKTIEELESYKKSLIYEYVTGKKEVAAC